MIEQQDFQFLQAFWTRRAIVAYSLFAFNIIVFVLMAFAGGSENESTLLAFGAKQNLLIDNGEIWRFITPIFIHIGLLHLAFNSYALWIVGPQVEKLYGGPRFLTLYLLTGSGGRCRQLLVSSLCFVCGGFGRDFRVVWRSACFFDQVPEDDTGIFQPGAG